jgi:D-3-phosphoglycerate dehydrogenase
MIDSSLPVVLAMGHRFASLEIERATLKGAAEIVDGNALPAGQLAAALQQASVVMLGTRARLDVDTVKTLSNCQAIIRYGIGVDNVAVEQATAQGIPVINIPEYCIHEVSDHTVALILAVVRRLIPARETVLRGQWGPAVMHGTPRLATLAVGIVGFGRIGQQVARKVRSIVDRVLVYDPFVPGERMREHGVQARDLEDLLAEADVVSINCPLTGGTRHLINAKALARMKPTAWLINTSRGEIVEEQDLIQALRLGQIQGAALDVLVDEPPAPHSPLIGLPNVIVTPHVAWYSEDAVQDLQRLAAEQALRVLRGQQPQWIVNAPAAPHPDDAG